MKVLLIGSRGQLGRELVKANYNSVVPIEVVTPSRRQLDLTRIEAIWPTLQDLSFDAVINCTGFHDVDEVERETEMAFTVNTYAVQELARSCELKGATLIHISTDYVFGGDETRTRPLTECSIVAPVNVYGSSKLLGETLASLECENVVVLRVASLFGVGGMSRSGSNFVEIILNKSRDGKEFPVVHDQTISPCGTEDVAGAILKLLREGCAPGVYHAVNTGQVTRSDFAREILRQMKRPDVVRPCTSEAFPTLARRPRYSALDNSKFCSKITAMPDWRDALARYLRGRSGF